MARLRSFTHRYGRVTLATLGGFLTSIGLFMIVVSVATVSRVAKADDCLFVQGNNCPLGYHWVEGNCSTPQCIENCCSYCCADVVDPPPEESCDQGTCDNEMDFPGEEEDENPKKTCSDYTMVYWYTYTEWRCYVPNERRDLYCKGGGAAGCSNCECWVGDGDHEANDPCVCAENAEEEE